MTHTLRWYGRPYLQTPGSPIPQPGAVEQHAVIKSNTERRKAK